MEKDVIRIGEPYIASTNEAVRLCSDITNDHEKRTLFYEVEPLYEDFLNIDNSDAFVLGLLHDAMFEDKDIVCEGGITDRLLFQLNTYYLPVVGQRMPDLHPIHISCKKRGTVCKSGNGVMTGCSGGVDSFYTMLKYKEEPVCGYSLTHVLFNNISTADNDEGRIRAVFKKDIIEKRAIAEELGLTPIMLFTNLYSFYKSQHIYNYYFASQYVSAPYALGRLISKYYFSSGFSVSDFSIDPKGIKDGAYFDLFSLNCFSNEYMSIYSAGSEVSRFDKTKYIANDATVKKHLQVCSEEQYLHFYESNPNRKLETLNCGSCGKCTRTITTLYSLNCLDEYKDIFDLSAFKKNKEKFIARELEYDSKAFTEEIYRNLRGCEYNRFKLMLYRIPYAIRHELKKWTGLRKVYRFFRYGER